MNNEIDYPIHTKDEDCTVDPETLECTICQVYHGDPCEKCGGTGFHKGKCLIVSCAKPDVGEFIEIPTRQTAGIVVAVESAWHGPDSAFRAMIQEYPEQSVHNCRWYHLEPGDFRIVG